MKQWGSGVLRRFSALHISLRAAIWAIIGISAAAVVAFYHIGSLVGGYSQDELTAAVNYSSWSNIWLEPIYALHKILAHLVSYLVNPLIAGRLASALLFVVAVILFYRLLSYWHNRPVAIWGTALFTCAATFVHYGRWGVGVISSVLILVALITIAVRVKHTKDPSRWWLHLLVLLAAVSLYQPGLIWFVVLLLFTKPRKISRWVRSFSGQILLETGILAAALLVPLGWYVAVDPLHGLLSIAGLSDHVSSLGAALSSLWHLPIEFVYGGYKNPQLWLGDVPLTSIFVSIMTVLGAYYYIARYQKLKRSKFLAFGLLLAIALTIVSSYALLPLLLVFIFIGAAGGIEELRRRWFAVFPRNTLAQKTGIILVSGIVALSCSYNLRHYFIAWPSAPATKRIYVIKP